MEHFPWPKHYSRLLKPDCILLVRRTCSRLSAHTTTTGRSLSLNETSSLFGAQCAIGIVCVHPGWASATVGRGLGSQLRNRAEWKRSSHQAPSPRRRPSGRDGTHWPLLHSGSGQRDSNHALMTPQSASESAQNLFYLTYRYIKSLLFSPHFPGAPQSERPLLPKRVAALWEGPARFGRNRESRSQEAAGRRNWPEAVPKKMSSERG